MKQIFCILLIISALSFAKKPVPKYIKTCKRNDPNINECFANNAKLAMSHIAKGDKDYDIKTLLPLNWRELLIVDMPPLKLELVDIIVYGTENMSIVNPKIDFEAQTIEFLMTNPKIIWTSKYVVEINVNGTSNKEEGNAEIYFRNGKFLFTYGYELQNINGTEYANITKFDGDFLKVDVDFKLDNLGENPVIKYEFEKVKEYFINDQVVSACSQTVGSYIDKIFNVVPFDQVFPH